MGGEILKLIKQTAIIFGIYFLGEFIQNILALPIPGSVLGMLILLVLLCTGHIKLEMINDISDFLLNYIAFFFIPAGVSIISSFSILKGNWLAIISVAIISTIITLAVTALIIQLLMRGEN